MQVEQRREKTPIFFHPAHPDFAARVASRMLRDYGMYGMTYCKEDPHARILVVKMFR
jgi:hypothetical protein